VTVEVPNFKNKTARDIYLFTHYYNLNFKEVAEKLGLSYGYIRRLASKHKIWRYKKVTKTVTHPNRCPECGGNLERRDGEVVCLRCGLVVDEELEAVHSLPFDQTWQPSNNLYLGRGLGQPTLTNKYRLYSVLAKAPAGKQDLPIRARHITTLMQYREHPAVTSALKTAYNLATKYGFKEDDDAHVMWLDGLGKLTRQVASFLAISGGDTHSAPHYARAVFVYYVAKTISEEKAGQIKKALRVTNQTLNFVSDLLERYGWKRYLRRLHPKRRCN